MSAIRRQPSDIAKGDVDGGIFAKVELPVAVRFVENGIAKGNIRLIGLDDGDGLLKAETVLLGRSDDKLFSKEIV